jgi:hypothetical protein
MTRLNKCFFLLLCLAAVQAFAQSPAINQSTADEIETLLNTNAVTYSQAVRFVLEAADLAEIADPGAAFLYAKEQNLLPKKAAPDAAVTLENISFILMKSFKIKGGIHYTISNNPHYAYRELVYKEIIQGRADPGMKVSGDQLLFMIGKLLSTQEKKSIIVGENE